MQTRGQAQHKAVKRRWGGPKIQERLGEKLRGIISPVIFFARSWAYLYVFNAVRFVILKRGNVILEGPPLDSTRIMAGA